MKPDTSEIVWCVLLLSLNTLLACVNIANGALEWLPVNAVGMVLALAWFIRLTFFRP